MQTPETTYDELTDRVAALYEQGAYQAALDQLDPADESLRPWLAELTHLRACLLAVLGEPEAALAALQSAAGAGAWWDESLLTEDDDLAGLQALPGFTELLDVSEAHRAAANPETATPVLELPPGEVRGVVVALHGAGQRATHAARDWGRTRVPGRLHRSACRIVPDAERPQPGLACRS